MHSDQAEEKERTCDVLLSEMGAQMEENVPTRDVDKDMVEVA